MLKKSLKVVVLFVFAVATFCLAAVACNTPVYRYAMYNWQTAPYIAFYFHEGEIDAEAKAVHETIEKLSEEWPPEANLRIEPVDVSDEKKMEALPEFVIEAWKSHEEGKTPAYVIFSPSRGHVFSGDLNSETVEKLIDSPARQKFGQLLEKGNAAVMILLTCADEAQNEKAEEALAQLRKMAESGEIPVELELPPMGLPGQEQEGDEAAEGEAPDSNKLGIAVLKVDRGDPAEEFFVRSLMSIEDDLGEYADQPMIFAGYGRGRAMEPYIGKGITPENLVDVVAFLAGACSCMVKEQNPGADLLVRWNWDATADKMAENDPSLDYGPYGPQGYGEFPAEPAAGEPAMSDEQAASDESTMPDEQATPDEPAEMAANDAPPEAAGESQPGTTAQPASEATIPENPEAGDVASDTAPATAPAVTEEISSEPAEGSDESGPHEAAGEALDHGAPVPAESFAGRRMLTYGVGFGAVALGVLLAGLALVLRRP